MTVERKQMCDKMITKYGFENSKTIYFCKVAEECENIVSVLKLFFTLY